MKLEQWIQQDMRHYIKQHEAVQEEKQNVRHEDFGIIGNKDYVHHITAALKQQRFGEATILFKELKQRFLDASIEHQEERRMLYRILQRCYKLIYDYVADQHKTARILSQLSANANPFDEAMRPVDMKQLRDSETSLPSVEEAMFKDELPIDSFFSQQKKTTTADDLTLPPLVDANMKKQDSSSASAKETSPAPSLHDAYDPPWNPPTLSKLEDVASLPLKPYASESFPEINTKEDKELVQEEPTPTLDDPQVIFSTATSLLNEARGLLMRSETQNAQQKLIEARYEISRLERTDLFEQLLVLEQAVGQQLQPKALLPEDHEVFSSTYLQGIQAMASGDWPRARDFFLQRVQQAPYDKAAQIRLTECMEVLHGKT